MKAMILAAGIGSRMRPLTLTTPKPLLPIAGKPLIEHHIEKLVANGIHDLVINVSHLGEQIVEYVGNGSRWGAYVSYSFEAAPLETAGGIRKALHLLGNDPFIVVNGDVWTDYNFLRLQLIPPALAHLVLVPNPSYRNGAGDFDINAEGRVCAAAGPYTFSGISVIDPDLLAVNYPGEERLGAVLQRGYSDVVITAEVYGGTWADIGTPERLAELDQACRSAHQC